MPWRTYIALVVAALLSACAGVGIVETDDPYTKLSQAQQLTGSGRAAQARRQLDEAIAIFQAKGEDIGLAQAYRQYGILSEMGGGLPGVILFRAPNPNYNPTREDLELSNQYYVRSADLLEKLNRFDVLPNTYIRLGTNHSLLLAKHGQAASRGEACAYFDRALQASRQAEMQNPGIVFTAPPGMRNFADFMAKAKSGIGCT